MTLKDVIDFTEKFWLQAVLTGLCGLLTLKVKTTYSKIQKDKKEREQGAIAEKERQAVMKEAILALLHNSLIQATLFYLKEGHITSDELSNLEIMYAPYSALDGNGTVKHLMEKVRNDVTVVPPDYIKAQYS